MEAADAQLGDTQTLIAAGEFQPLLEWLQKNVHAQGGCFEPTQLIERVCGKPLACEPLVKYLRQKLEPIYGLN